MGPILIYHILPRLFVKIMRDLANEGTDTKLHTTFFKLVISLGHQDYN